MEKGYCVKCREKNREMVKAKKTTLKNGRQALKGQCKKCGCNMMKFVASSK
jgi:hypothetical protein